METSALADDRLELVYEKVITGNGELPLTTRMSNAEERMDAIEVDQGEHRITLRDLEKYINVDIGRKESQEKLEAKRTRDIKIFLSIIGLLLSYVALKLQFHW